MTKKDKILKLQKYVEYSHLPIYCTHLPLVHFYIPLSLVAAKFKNYQKYVSLVKLNKVERKCCLVDFYLRMGEGYMQMMTEAEQSRKNVVRSVWNLKLK